jgi:hypothetical protein
MTPGLCLRMQSKYRRLAGPPKDADSLAAVTALACRLQAGPVRGAKGILLLCDFAHVADEISAGEAYGNMTRCGGDFRRAFAACVLNAGY